MTGVQTCALPIYARFKMGELPLAFVSMDNCSQNGKRLQDAVLTIAREWCERGFVEKRFLSYLTNPRKISFPWTMIDKITPHPAESVQMTLNHLGFMDMDIVVTGAKNLHRTLCKRGSKRIPDCRRQFSRRAYADCHTERSLHGSIHC